jgi:hypothetical protein
VDDGGIARGALLLVAALALAGCVKAPPAVQSAAAAEPPSPLPRAAVPSPTVDPLPVGCSPRAEACVSTSRRLAWLQRDGRVLLAPVPVSLGTRHHPTPRGVFHVAWKDAVHTSSTYGLDMPWSVFFAAGGVAFHQGPTDEASHGCVHLPPAAARAFFEHLQRGDRVEVF